MHLWTKPIGMIERFAVFVVLAVILIPFQASFEEYLFEEIPNILKFWSDEK